MQVPVVSIVGRPNVGKSSLLNCLAGRRISIVDAVPGVTRDRVSTTVSLGGPGQQRLLELVDTGGMGIEDSDRLTGHVEGQIAQAMDLADVVLFVVDAREGIQPLDRHVAERLRRLDKTVLLVANKIDEARVIGETGELYGLGFGEPIAISAIHQSNIGELLDRLADVLPDAPGDPEPQNDAPAMKLAIVGKRNAGKSTFINALAGQQRVIVSEVPGTTRDSVDVRIQADGRELLLIDTAGVRRKKSLANDVEYYSQHRALRSVRRADVVAMVIDASVKVSQVDKNLAGVIAGEFKPVLIMVNKWDLARDASDPEAYQTYFEKTFPELSFAPISFTTATEGVNLHETLDLAGELLDQARTRVGTGQLNQVIEEISALRGPSHKAGTKPPKIYYASQVDVAPPTIVCFVNDPRSFDEGYRRFLVNRLREHLPFTEVPIRLFFRSRHERT
jgi:GTPase